MGGTYVQKEPSQANAVPPATREAAWILEVIVRVSLRSEKDSEYIWEKQSMRGPEGGPKF